MLDFLRIDQPLESWFSLTITGIFINVYIHIQFKISPEEISQTKIQGQSPAFLWKDVLNIKSIWTKGVYIPEVTIGIKERTEDRVAKVSGLMAEVEDLLLSQMALLSWGHHIQIQSRDLKMQKLNADGTITEDQSKKE